MFFFFTCSSDEDENKDNIHDPNFMQKEKTVLLYESVFPTLQFFPHVKKETFHTDIVIDWP